MAQTAYKRKPTNANGSTDGQTDMKVQAFFPLVPPTNKENFAHQQKKKRVRKKNYSKQVPTNLRITSMQKS